MVDPVNSKSNQVTGITKPHTTVTVKDEVETNLGEAPVDEAGYFEVEIPVQAAGTKLKVIVSDKTGKVLDEVVVEVIEAPEIDVTVLKKLIDHAKTYEKRTIRMHPLPTYKMRLAMRKKWQRMRKHKKK
ncbi:Ig-like domain-containing protein [Paracerasibacillus soli]|uniref:Ig-like domain-containing protein n=1 Tax=Paracerasibacillus soli TaxID=480284 RepID=A0ABU5CUP4_9BACI|nr:Ig-like domain-containing protein [Virgibacillus soli]MDY0410092.1 Ig-like domain-containing protein [Virgibacillus soli]